MKRLLTAVCLALTAAGTARADGETAQPVKVPFELLKTGHMLVTVKINGEGPYRMIFDTGAPVTLLNDRTARATGVVDKKAKQGAGIMMLLSGTTPRANSMELGDVKAKDLPVMVMDHPLIKLMAKHLKRDIEGIVGLSFFGRYRMTIDYQAKEMTFVPTKFRPPDMMARMSSMLMGGGGKAKREVLAPAAQWGFGVDKKKDDTEAGVDVKTVLPGSPAAAAGLKAGDRLLTLHGRWTDTVLDTYRAAGHVAPGTAAQLGIRRDGKEMELTVTVRSGL
jgi:hypothetical protein